MCQVTWYCNTCNVAGRLTIKFSASLPTVPSTEDFMEAKRLAKEELDVAHKGHDMLILSPQF